VVELKRKFIFICVLLASVLFSQAFSAMAEKPEVSFRVLNSPIGAAAGASVEIVIQTDIVKPFHIYAPGDKTGIALSYSIASPAVESFKASYPAPVIKDYPSLGEKLLLYEGVIYSTIEIKISPAVQSGFKLPIKASYQACTDMMCTPPAAATLEAELNVTGLPAAGAVSAASTPGAPPAADTVQPQKQKSSFAQFYERSLLLAVAVAFLWGLISSLTPCVYPMIPITVAFFGSQGAAGSRKKTFSLALVFVIGIAVSFAALGVAVTLIGVDLGSIMSNAWVVGLLSALLLFFAGAMFELYEIRVPDSIMSKVGQSEQGYFGAFTMGLTMGLVAAPCVGPFAGSLLIFVSAVNSPAIGFLMLFSYGMGLGMLFLAVALGAGFLPKSGMWMVRLKNFFGIVILWLTLYFMQFVTPLYAMYAAASFYAVVTAAVLGVFSAVDENSPMPVHFAKGAGMVFIALAALIAFACVLESGLVKIPLPAYNPAAEKSNSGAAEWIKNYDEGMKKARLEKKPVIIDFYADWCIPCKQIEAEIFKNPDFISASERFVKIKLDCTNPSDEGAVIKNKIYNSPYMPFIVFYDSAGKLSGSQVQGYTSLKEMLEIMDKIR